MYCCVTASSVHEMLPVSDVFGIIPSFPLLGSSRYRPTLRVSFISTELGFASDEECVCFLEDAGAVMDGGSTTVDCKLTSTKLSS